MRLDTRDHIQAEIFFEGAYERESLALAQRLLGPGDCFLDVGANVGQYSLAAARLVGPEGRVIAIEPNPETLYDLFWNRRANRLEETIEIVSGAVGTSFRALRFSVPPPSNRGISRRQDEHRGEDYFALSTRISDLCRDMNIKAVRLLKIDVEGYEEEALAGSLGQSISIDNILFEHIPGAFGTQADADRVIALLRQHEYEILTVEGEEYRGARAANEANLWARKRSLFEAE